VYPASAGFGRKLFMRHDEIDYGIPFERHRECLKEAWSVRVRSVGSAWGASGAVGGSTGSSEGAVLGASGAESGLIGWM
jgi:hypothetical protein